MIKALSVVGIVVGTVLGMAMYLSHHTPPRILQGFNPTGGNTYVLQSSISSTQTSITLTSFLEPGSSIPYTMSYINTDIIYGTIAPTSGNSEFISATGITQNSNGTATLTGVVRGLARTPGTGGCVASSTLAHAYPGQTNFILSNSPCFYGEYAVRRNPQSITGVWTYTLPPVSVTPTTSTQVATKGYVDGVAVSGAPNADTSTKGIVEIATAAEAASSTSVGSTAATVVIAASSATDTPNTNTRATRVLMSDMTGFLKQGWINLTQAFTWSGNHTFNTGLITFNSSSTFSATTTVATSTRAIDFDVTVTTLAGTTFTGYGTPQPAYIATSTASTPGKLQLSDADAYGAQDFDGFVVSSGAANDQVYLQKDGIVTGFSGLTPGARYYVQNAVGTIGVTPGTAEIVVGRALTATQLLITDEAISGSGQYLGSVAFSNEVHTVNSCTAYATSTFPTARRAVISAVAAGSGGSSYGHSSQFSLFKFGATTGTASHTTTQAGPQIETSSVSVTWNTTNELITLTGATVVSNTTALTCSGTAYFYR